MTIPGSDSINTLQTVCNAQTLILEGKPMASWSFDLIGEMERMRREMDRLLAGVYWERKREQDSQLK